MDRNDSIFRFRTFTLVLIVAVPVAAVAVIVVSLLSWDRGHLTSWHAGPAIPAFPALRDGQYQYRDYSGQVVFGGPYTYATQFSEGLAAVMEVGSTRVGYIDVNGDMVIPPSFEMATAFRNGLALAKMNGKTGVIDRRGQWIVRPGYERIAPVIDHGLITVMERGKYGVLTLDGRTVVPLQYDFADAFSEGLACVMRVIAPGEFRMGYIDVTGEIAIPLEYRSTGTFRYGLGPVTLLDGSVGYVDRQGNLRFHGIFDGCDSFSEERAVVIKNELAGYIDLQGELIVEPQYVDAKPFAEGLAAVRSKENRLYGYIDRAGQLVIEPQFKRATRFRNGVAAVNKGGTMAYINRHGEWIVRE